MAPNLGGALDHDVVAQMTRNRAEAAMIRRLAQEGASGRYLAFREQAPAVASRDTAA